MTDDDLLSNPHYHKKLVNFLTTHNERLDKPFFLQCIKNHGLEIKVETLWNPFGRYRVKINEKKNCILINRAYIYNSKKDDMSSL